MPTTRRVATRRRHDREGRLGDHGVVSGQRDLQRVGAGAVLGAWRARAASTRSLPVTYANNTNAGTATASAVLRRRREPQGEQRLQDVHHRKATPSVTVTWTELDVRRVRRTRPPAGSAASARRPRTSVPPTRSSYYSGSDATGAPLAGLPDGGAYTVLATSPATAITQSSIVVENASSSRTAGPDSSSRSTTPRTRPGLQRASSGSARPSPPSSSSRTRPGRSFSRRAIPRSLAPGTRWLRPDSGP